MSGRHPLLTIDQRAHVLRRIQATAVLRVKWRGMSRSERRKHLLSKGHWPGESYAQLAEAFGVSREVIQDIADGRVYVRVNPLDLIKLVPRGTSPNNLQGLSP